MGSRSGPEQKSREKGCCLLQHRDRYSSTRTQGTYMGWEVGKENAPGVMLFKIYFRTKTET